jgi:hypothetical protein
LINVKLWYNKHSDRRQKDHVPVSVGRQPTYRLFGTLCSPDKNLFSLIQPILCKPVCLRLHPSGHQGGTTLQAFEYVAATTVEEAVKALSNGKKARPLSGGTDLLAVHENLPPGLSTADNEIGWTMALDKLTVLVAEG